MTKRNNPPAPDRSVRVLTTDALSQVGGGDGSKIMTNSHELKKALIANMPR